MKLEELPERNGQHLWGFFVDESALPEVQCLIYCYTDSFFTPDIHAPKQEMQGVPSVNTLEEKNSKIENLPKPNQTKKNTSIIGNYPRKATLYTFLLFFSTQFKFKKKPTFFKVLYRKQQGNR